MAMSKFPSRSKRSTASKAEVGSAEFKARCLELIDHVKESRAEYIVTRHGTPVAKLVPVDVREKISIIGCMQGTVLKFDEPFESIPAAWSVESPDDFFSK